MVHSDDSRNPKFLKSVFGALVDDGALNDGVVLQELCYHADTVMPGWNRCLDPKPVSLTEVNYREYDMSSHASDKRLILSSVLLSVLSEDGAEINIRLIVFDSPSQWNVWGSITRRCDIKREEDHYLELPIPTKVNTPNFIALIEWNMHCYISADIFYHHSLTTVQLIRTLSMDVASTSVVLKKFSG